MSALTTLLDTYRNAAVSEREKGTYFEELIVCYLHNEATYRDLYSDVWTYAQWAKLQGIDQPTSALTPSKTLRSGSSLSPRTVKAAWWIYMTARPLCWNRRTRFSKIVLEILFLIPYHLNEFR